MARCWTLDTSSDSRLLPETSTKQGKVDVADFLISHSPGETTGDLHALHSLSQPCSLVSIKYHSIYSKFATVPSNIKR